MPYEFTYKFKFDVAVINMMISITKYCSPNYAIEYNNIGNINTLLYLVLLNVTSRFLPI